MENWDWDEGEARWQLRLPWERWYPSRGWFRAGRWRKDSIVLAVAGTPDFCDAGLQSRVRDYAKRVTDLEQMISRHLAGREVRVYDTAWEGPKLPSDSERSLLVMVVHPVDVKAELAEISIADLDRPERVQVWVETCYPDPYFRYFAVFEAGEMVDVFGEVW